METRVRTARHERGARDEERRENNACGQSIVQALFSLTPVSRSSLAVRVAQKKNNSLGSITPFMQATLVYTIPSLDQTAPPEVTCYVSLRNGVMSE